MLPRGDFRGIIVSQPQLDRGESATRMSFTRSVKYWRVQVKPNAIRRMQSD